MFVWLERRSTQTAVSIPAAVPATRGLRWTEPPPPPASSLTFTSGATHVWSDAVRLRKKMSGLPAPLRSSCQTAYALLAPSSAIAGLSWIRVPVSVLTLVLGGDQMPDTGSRLEK